MYKHKKLLFLIITIIIITPITYIYLYSNFNISSKNKSKKYIPKEVHQTVASFIKVYSIFYTKIEDKKDEQWKIDLTLVNGSNNVIYLSTVLTGCGCIKSKYNKEPIKPKQKFKISFCYTPYNKEVHFSKDIMIFLNDGIYYYAVNLHQ